MILLLTELLPPIKEQPAERRHIVIVFKLVQELLEPVGMAAYAEKGLTKNFHF